MDRRWLMAVLGALATAGCRLDLDYGDARFCATGGCDEADAAAADDAAPPSSDGAPRGDARVGDVLYFPFDGPDHLIDRSRGVEATPIGSDLSIVPGRHGSAIQTSADFQLVLDDDELYSGTPEFTFEAWINRAADTCSTLFSDFGELDARGPRVERSFEISSTRSLRFLTNDGADEVVAETPPDAILPGVWHHVAYVRTGTSLTYLVDGTPIFAVPPAGSSIGRTGVYRIGGRPTAACPFVGVIDELKLSSYAKSPAEIAASMDFDPNL